MPIICDIIRQITLQDGETIFDAIKRLDNETGIKLPKEDVLRPQDRPQAQTEPESKAHSGSEPVAQAEPLPGAQAESEPKAEAKSETKDQAESVPDAEQEVKKPKARRKKAT